MNARRLTLATLVCLVSFALGSANALAARGHVFSLSFGGTGAGEGQLSAPAGVTVNEASGDVYVADKGNDRVERFTSLGSYVGEFNGSGANLAVEGKAAPTGRFSEPRAIAVDNEQGSPSFGDVYVADTGHDVVDKFTSTGEYVGQLTESSTGASFGFIAGLATDGQGKLWVCQESREIDAFDNAAANVFLSKITSTGLFFGEVGCGFAVDSKDDLYGRSGFTGIGKLDSTGKVLILEFDSLLKEFFGVRLGEVAVDLSNDEVYIGNADAENSIGRFTSKGQVVETFGSEHLSAASGIAVDAGTGTVYVADEATGKVDVFALEPEARPTIESEGASSVTGTSATLSVKLKATGPDTHYYFQYGPTDCAASPSSCVDLPAAPGIDLGSGFESLNASVHLQGLQPNTVYRFRVIASNELGTSEGAERSFVTQAAGGEFGLPDGRQWEMVTPPDKHGSDLTADGNEQGADIQAAADGHAITYGATSPFAANPGGSRSPEVTQVFSARQAPGVWATQDITTPHDEGGSELAVGSSAEYKLFSSDLSLGLVEPEGDTPLPPLPPNAEKTPYLRTASGEYRAIATPENVSPGVKYNGSGEIVGGVQFVSASRDLSHIVVESPLQLTSTPLPREGYYLYMWVAGRFQLASILPNDEPTPASLGDRGDRTGGDVRDAISDSGSRLVFETEGHDYLRDMESGQTVQLDTARGIVEPPSGSSVYQAADSEDTRVFFTSAQRLTADATASTEYPQAEDLYEFETTGAAGEPPAGRLADLTVDARPGESAGVRGVIGASEDGTYVYFVANGVLGDGAERGAKPGNCERGQEAFKETCNLYAEHLDGGTHSWEPPTFVATLSGADAPSWGTHSDSLKFLTARVSPSGRYLTFMSERSLTDYENRDAVSGIPDEEVYLYDDGAHRLVCASCNPTGARPAGFLEGTLYEERLVDYSENWPRRWLAGNVPGWTTKDLSNAIYQSRYLSDSGRLFFDSSDALVPADVNGKADVYEYEPEGVGSCQGPSHGQSASDVYDEAAAGCVGLISAGTSAEESAFLDASETGGDVFFITGSRLAPQDYDTSLDLYDAHECSASAPCAPPQAQAPPPCTTGDACKPAPTPQPAVFGAPSSQTFTGAGNVTPAAPSPQLTNRTRIQTGKRAKALRACRKRPRKQRPACERRARRRYAAKRSRAAKRPSTTTGR